MKMYQKFVIHLDKFNVFRYNDSFMATFRFSDGF